ncbi:MAG: isoaspartyl peptidase/L-asparaginase, partial [Saprospiraceae bacterium]
MNSRRKFLANAGMLGLGIPALTRLWPFKDKSASDQQIAIPSKANRPVVISTWSFGVQANVAAWEILGKRGYALDAVEAAARVVEADPSNQSVGYGGFPDRDGHVTLDACIMDENGNAGSVTYLENIMHPASVARKVMELTPHVMLSGKGALNFALQQGFEKQNLLTDESRAAWEAWKIKAQYEPIINIENHDTIGILALDQEGRLCGTCTTSGLAFKMNGRVG